MIDSEKSNADIGLKLRRIIVEADQEIADVVDDTARMEKLNERFMGAIKKVTRGNIQTIGRRHHARGNIVSVPKDSNGSNTT